ncbi:hypothetical protein ES706_02374 [subsurface metagenome]
MKLQELEAVFREAKELKMEIFWPCRVVGELKRKLGREPTFDEFAEVVRNLPEEFTPEDIQKVVHGKIVGKPKGTLVVEDILETLSKPS